MFLHIKTLLLVFITAISLYVLLNNTPVATIQNTSNSTLTIGATHTTFLVNDKTNKMADVPNLIVIGMICLVSFGSMFLYQNLPMQYKAVRILFLLGIIALILPISSAMLGHKDIKPIWNMQSVFLFLPLILSIFTLWSIRKQLKFIASMRRIR